MRYVLITLPDGLTGSPSDRYLIMDTQSGSGSGFKLVALIDDIAVGNALVTNLNS